MNITIVASRYLPALGGVEIVVQNLAKEWKKQGHNIQIITNRFCRRLSQSEVMDGINVDRFFYAWGLPPFSLLSILKFIVQLLLVPYTLIGTYRLLRKQKTEIVNLHFVGAPSLYIYALSFLYRCKCVISLHGEDVEIDPFRSRARMALLRNLLKRADLITSNSKYLEKKAASLVSDISKKLVAIGNGVDVEEIDRIPPYDHGKPYILGMGRLVHKKGMDILVKAFARLSRNTNPLDLIIGGDGPESGKIRALVGKLGVADRVTFRSEVSRWDSIALLKGAEALVVPSRREPFGIVILEGAAAGKPVVAARVGGIPELAEVLQNIILVEPENPEELQGKIAKVLENKNRHFSTGRFREIDRVLTTRYSWPRIADNLIELICSL